MAIYDRPTKTILAEWAKEHLTPGQVFGKAEAIRWFAEHYPKIKRNTVSMHFEGIQPRNRLFAECRIRRNLESAFRSHLVKLRVHAGPSARTIWSLAATKISSRVKPKFFIRSACQSSCCMMGLVPAPCSKSSWLGTSDRFG